MSSVQAFKNRPIIVFVLSLGIIATFAFWLTAQKFDIYKYAVVGAIYEILWLPMLAVTFATPFVSLFFWYRDGWRVSSRFLITAVISVALLVLYIFRQGN